MAHIVQKLSLLNNAFITLVSRILGLLRDLLFARYLGVSGASDAFFVAFRLPNIFRRLLAEGVMMQTMVPSILEAKQQQDFYRVILGWLCGLLLLVSLPFVCFPYQTIWLYTPGLVGTSTYDLVVMQVPWTFPYLCLISLCGFYTVILNIKRHLWVTSCLPIILNMCLIVGVSQNQGVLLVSKMVLVAGVLQLMICISVMRYLKQPILPKSPAINPETKQFFKTAMQGIAAQLMLYFSSCFDLWMLSFLSTGFVTVFYYADRMMQLPLGIFSVTLANIYAPLFAQAHLTQQTERLDDLIQQAMHKTLAIALPSMVGLYSLSNDIMLFLYGKGQVEEMIQQSSIVLKGLVIALPAYMLVKILTTIAFARKMPKKVLKVAAKSLIISIVISLSLFRYLGFLAIVCAIVLSAWYQCYGLYQQFIQSHHCVKEKELWMVFCATGVMWLWLWLLYPFEGFIWLIVKVISSMIVYDFVLKRFGNSLKSVFILDQKREAHEVI